MCVYEEEDIVQVGRSVESHGVIQGSANEGLTEGALTVGGEVSAVSCL